DRRGAEGALADGSAAVVEGHGAGGRAKRAGQCGREADGGMESAGKRGRSEAGDRDGLGDYLDDTVGGAAAVVGVALVDGADGMAALAQAAGRERGSAGA